MRILLAALFLLLAAAPASANVTGDWGRYADVASRFDVPLPDVYVHRGGCPAWTYGDAAPPCSDGETENVWIPDGSDRFTLAHELGHQFDRQHLTDAVRARLRPLMRADSGEWSRPNGPNEFFADFYADCAVGLGRRSAEGYIDRPSPRRLARVCAVIRASAS